MHPGSGPSKPGDLDTLLRAARERINGCDSVAARLRYRIHLFGNELIGSGLYQQQGQGSARRLRLELKTEFGERAASLVQVCDGQSLWTYHEFGGKPQLMRLDLRRVRASQRQFINVLPTSPVDELATGGLPRLLEGLWMHFQPLQVESGYLGDIAVWAIEVEWKENVFAALAPEVLARRQPGEALDFTALPQMPERVMIFLGHDDLFPRRIEFRRRREAEGEGESSAAAFVPVVTLEFSDIAINQPVDPRQFDYQPGPVGPIDVTEQFLESRGLPIVR
jgi:hypothetical protein